MCLSKISKEKPPKGEILAYKEFAVRFVAERNESIPDHQLTRKLNVRHAHFSDAPLKLDTWNVDKTKGMIHRHSMHSKRISYPRGFHAYAKNKPNIPVIFTGFMNDVFSRTIRVPVRLRKVHTVGTQDGKVYVAKELYVASADIYAIIMPLATRNKPKTTKKR